MDLVVYEKNFSAYTARSSVHNLRNVKNVSSIFLTICVAHSSKDSTGDIAGQISRGHPPEHLSLFSRNDLMRHAGMFGIRLARNLCADTPFNRHVQASQG